MVGRRAGLSDQSCGHALRAGAARGETLERCILAWAAEKRGPVDGSDLLSIVVNNPEDDGNAARDTTIVGLMPQLFGAVFETCQNALIWTLFLLAQHPRVAGDLLDELQTQLIDGPPTLRNIVDLPLLDAVIKESLRLLPPAPMQARVAQQDTTLGGHPVPKGSRVMLSAFVTNRMPARYPEPDSFRPQRWATINPTPFEYLVFSAGPRNCPGYLLGMAMVKVAVATFLRRHRIEFPAAGRLDYISRPGLRPRGKVPAILRRQDAHSRDHGSRATFSNWSTRHNKNRCLAGCFAPPQVTPYPSAAMRRSAPSAPAPRGPAIRRDWPASPGSRSGCSPRRPGA